MPTAAEYDLWAWGLNERADELTGLMGPSLAMATPEVLIGGSIAVSVDTAVRAASENSLGAASKLRELARECEDRAQICRDYEAAMLEYEGRVSSYNSAMSEYGRAVEAAQESGGYVGSPPSAPREPVRPHPWVER